MSEDTPPSEGKPAPPPPDVAKSAPPPPDVAGSTPPPAPPAPPAPPQQDSSEPPLQIGGGSASSASAPPVDKDAPGADASIGNRIVATILDMLVVAGITVAVSIVLNILPFPRFLERLVAYVGWAYLVVRDCLPFLDGQSIGKKAMKLRAVTLDGQPLTGNWNPGIIRNIVLLIPVFPLVELIVLLTRQDKPAPLQRLGDEWAKTKVINVGPDAPATTASSPPPASPQSGGQGDSTDL